MTWEPNVDSFRFDPYDPEDADGLLDTDLDLLLAELDAALPSEFEAGGDSPERDGDR
jgi:hypothetical protein